MSFMKMEISQPYGNVLSVMKMELYRKFALGGIVWKFQSKV